MYHARSKQRSKGTSSPRASVLRMLGIFVCGCFPLQAADLPSVGGFAQFDTQYGQLDGSPYQATTGIRRIRTDFKGKVGRFDYHINLDHGSGSSAMVDAYLSFDPTSDLNVRLGKAKSPMGFEILQAPTDLVFPEYGITYGFLPNRDTGVFLTYRGSAWQVVGAYLAGSPDGASLSKNTDTSGALVGRATSVLGDFQLSLGGSVETRANGLASSGLLPSYAISGGSTFFSYDEDSYAEGLFYRVVPNMVWKEGAFGSMSEGVVSSGFVRNGANRARLTHYAWQMTWYWNLFGETTDIYGRTDFDHDVWQWGVRFGGARMDGASFPFFADVDQTESLFVLGTALNWYWGHEAKWSLGVDEVMHTAANGNVSRETIATGRLQLMF